MKKDKCSFTERRNMVRNLNSWAARLALSSDEQQRLCESAMGLFPVTCRLLAFDDVNNEIEDAKLLIKVLKEDIDTLEKYIKKLEAYERWRKSEETD